MNEPLIKQKKSIFISNGAQPILQYILIHVLKMLVVYFIIFHLQLKFMYQKKKTIREPIEMNKTLM